MATIEMHANRNLRPRVLSDGSRRGTERYFSFGHGVQPEWWRIADPLVKEAVVGVYENHQGSSEDALVITEGGFSVLLAGGISSIRFDDIDELMPPRKEPVPLGLCLRLRSIGEVTIPVLPAGAAFDFYRFLLSAVGDFRSPPRRTPG